jgi:hypothetical protein
MLMYPRRTCLDRPFSKELDDLEINTQLHKVLAHEAVLKPGAGPPS